MSVPAQKLTLYFNEMLRSGRELAADLLLDAFERANVKTSVLLRGIEGFGAHHRLHTERFENASLNQPIVAVAVDEVDRIEALVEQVDAILPSGLVTAERAWLLDEAGTPELPQVAHDSAKLTVYCGRAERVAGKPTFQAIVDHLRASGVEGATVFLGVDGTVHGKRERATFFSRNRDVPLMIISVGSREAVSRAIPGLAQLADAPIVTVEGIQICKQHGRLIHPPTLVADDDRVWRKLMIHAAGGTHVGGESLHYQLVEQLRRINSAGATSLRGIWGYRGDDEPHGDVVWSIRRTTPVVTIVIDHVSRTDETWEAIDLLTREAGFVTSELVPAHRAIGRSKAAAT